MNKKLDEKEFDASSIYYIISNRLKKHNTTRRVGDKHEVSSWEFSYVRKKDIDAEEECINSLLDLENADSKEATSKKSKNKKLVQNLSLAAKNRAEAISVTSDFYPVGGTVIVLGFAVFIALFDLVNQKEFKVVASISIFIVYMIYAIARFKTRQQVANLKTIANILDVTEKRI
jgi:hypothetical protein